MKKILLILSLALIPLASFSQDYLGGMQSSLSNFDNQHLAVITPSDSADLPNIAIRGIFVGTSGALKVTTVGGETVTMAAVPIGIFPVQIKRVFATGTTATNLVALY